MPEAGEESTVPVPDWAVKILQSTVRQYRYTGDYLPGTFEEKILLGLRRGDQPVGRISLWHTMRGPRHFLHLEFEAKDGGTREKFMVRTLEQMQRYTGFLLERVCKYGCSLDPRWCSDCSEAARHSQGQFRGLAQAPTPPDAPNA